MFDIVLSMDITHLLIGFHKFVHTSWDSLPANIKKNDNFELDDWLQGNWELIVETSLYHMLSEAVSVQIYGNGADLNGESSRVLFPDLKQTHAVKVNTDYEFGAFGTLTRDNFFIYDLPFDYIQTTDSNDVELIILFEGAKFTLEKYHDTALKNDKV